VRISISGVSSHKLSPFLAACFFASYALLHFLQKISRQQALGAMQTHCLDL